MSKYILLNRASEEKGPHLAVSGSQRPSGFNNRRGATFPSDAASEASPLLSAAGTQGETEHNPPLRRRFSGENLFKANQASYSRTSGCRYAEDVYSDQWSSWNDPRTLETRRNTQKAPENMLSRNPITFSASDALTAVNTDRSTGELHQWFIILFTDFSSFLFARRVFDALSGDSAARNFREIVS